MLHRTSITALAFLVILLCGLSSCCEDTVDPCPCLHPELQHPLYRGCDVLNTLIDDVYDCSSQALLNQVYQSIKYPAAAREDSIQGRVIISFDIGTDGHLSNYQVVLDTLGYGIPEAAIAGIMTLDELGFCPAMDRCKPVERTFVIPVTFKLL